jgi:hypothetical protein
LKPTKNKIKIKSIFCTLVLVHLPLPIPAISCSPSWLRLDDRPQQQRIKTGGENMRRNKGKKWFFKIQDFPRRRFRSVWRRTPDFGLCRRPLQSSLGQEDLPRSAHSTSVPTLLSLARSRLFSLFRSF